MISLTPNTRWENNYIEDIVHENLDIVPSGIVASNLDEFTTGPSCRSTTIREPGVRLLGVRERRSRELIKCVNGGSASQ
jgi:hypothetical protein